MNPSHDPGLIWQFVAVAFATWRLSTLFVLEDGPFDVFWRIRWWIGLERKDQFGKDAPPEGFLQGLFSCFSCFSVWGSSALWLLYLVAPEPVWLLAAMAGAAVIQRYVMSRL